MRKYQYHSLSFHIEVHINTFCYHYLPITKILFKFTTTKFALKMGEIWSNLGKTPKEGWGGYPIPTNQRSQKICIFMKNNVLQIQACSQHRRGASNSPQLSGRGGSPGFHINYSQKIIFRCASFSRSHCVSESVSYNLQIGAFGQLRVSRSH